MDLNDLYSRHQRLIIQASLASAASERVRQLGMASDCARRITQYQRECGAAAAKRWARVAQTESYPIPFPKENRA